MIRIYENWLQLTDNGWWGRKLTGHYDGPAFRRLCLGDTKAIIAPGNDTIIFCTNWAGYKLKLSQHTPEEQNIIIDTLTPYLQ